jgi:lambda family phage portal protein
MNWPFAKTHIPAKTGGELMSAHTVKPAHARAIIERGQIRGRKVRMFDAAATTNLNVDFPISITSANAEILVSIMAARSRARRLERDNPYASGIITTFQNNVVGDDPFRLEMKVGKNDASGAFIEEKETNQIIEQAWKDAGLPENCTVRRDTSRLELYHQALAAVIRDGGLLGRHYRGFPKNKFGYAIEAIETDRLDHNWNRPAIGTANEIQFSIEMDEYHAPIAYWILTRHPGDVFAWSNSVKYRERVDAQDVIAFFAMRSRAGQYIGMPRFSSIIQRLHRLDQYDVAEMTAAIVAACKMGFFTKTATTDEYVGDEQENDGQKTMKAEPGTFEELPEGYDYKEHDPKHPVEAYPNFTKQNLRSVATGTGLAYHTLANDLEGVNFSSGRLGENAQRDEFKKLQKHMIFSFVRPHFNEWLRYAIVSGALKLPPSRIEEFQAAAHFHAKRWPYVNPLQDVQADVLRIESGLTSRSRVIAESDRGGDVEQVDAEIASDKKVDEIHDLDFSSADPTTPTVGKGTPGETKPNTEDDPEADPEENDGGDNPPKNGKKSRARGLGRLFMGLGE